MTWTGAEAWIFLSIGDAAGTESAPLDRVIGMADSMNHAIPTVQEFNEAVGQLLGAQLIVVNDHARYGLTKSGHKLYKAINSQKRGHITRFIETSKEWSMKSPLESHAVTWAISPDEFNRAFEEYQRRFWETYRKLERRK